MTDTMLLTPQQRAIIDGVFPDEVTAIDTVAKGGQGWLMKFRDGIALLMPVIDGRAGFVCIYDAPSVEVAETAARVIAKGFCDTAATAVGDRVIADARATVDTDALAVGDQVIADARAATDPVAMLEMLTQPVPA
jgi:hypothetical protein